MTDYMILFAMLMYLGSFVGMLLLGLSVMSIIWIVESYMKASKK
jgi:hypothetical protein